MPVEEILINGQIIRTLKELLGPSLRAVIVGINPSPTAVERGHYWQGLHGQRMWAHLRERKILSLRDGVEDEDAFKQGIGFADLIRRPTRSAKEIPRREIAAAIPNLIDRIHRAGGKPLILFRYKAVYDLAAHEFHADGYQTLRFPSPYHPADECKRLMDEIEAALPARISP